MLFEIPLRVKPNAQNTEVPKTTVGAHVICYAAAPSVEIALQGGAAKLLHSGWHIDEVTGPVREIPAEKWSAYMSSVWPDYSDHFPAATEMPKRIAEGAVFFGVFATF